MKLLNAGVTVAFSASVDVSLAKSGGVSPNSRRINYHPKGLATIQQGISPELYWLGSH